MVLHLTAQGGPNLGSIIMVDRGRSLTTCHFGRVSDKMILSPIHSAVYIEINSRCGSGFPHLPKEGILDDVWRGANYTNSVRIIDAR